MTDGMQTDPSPGSIEDLNKFRAEVWDRIVKLEARVTELETPKEVNTPTPKAIAADAPEDVHGVESDIQTLVGELKRYGIHSALYVEPATEEPEPPATDASDETQTGQTL